MTRFPQEEPVTDVMELLGLGVPLTLLIDLADLYGPHSGELYLNEKSAA